MIQKLYYSSPSKTLDQDPPLVAWPFWEGFDEYILIIYKWSFVGKSSSVLGWKERVQIALHAASGKWTKLYS